MCKAPTLHNRRVMERSRNTSSSSSSVSSVNSSLSVSPTGKGESVVGINWYRAVLVSTGKAVFSI